MILDNFSFVKVNELDFLKAFKNEDFNSLFEKNIDTDSSFVLLDSNDDFYAVVVFDSSKGELFCSFYSSKDCRMFKNEFNPEVLSSTSCLNILHLEIDYLIEEEEKLLSKEDFFYKISKLKEKSFSPSTIPNNINDLHSKSQFFLKSIADIIEIDSWIAKNDKSRDIFGNELGINTLKTFPNLNCDKDTLNTIKLIDVIWFNGSSPFKCFEVETSTSIYSGILRFYDLQLTCPDLPIDFYIIIPKKRMNKLLKELSRPSTKSFSIFNKINVIFIEDLEILYQKINGLHGFIYHNILEKISYNYIEFSNYVLEKKGGFL